MTDDLEQLKQAMDAVTPTADAARRVSNTTLAREKFIKAQGLRPESRPTVRRGPLARMTEGAQSMLNTLSSRSALTATTAIAAVALFVFLPQTQGFWRQPDQWSEDHAVQSIAQSPEAENALVEAPVALHDLAAEPQTPAPAELRALSRSKVVEELSVSDGFANETRVERTRSEPIAVETNTETFANAESNALKVTADEPVSTFSIDVDTASYAIVRSSLMGGNLPPRDAVRIEEMVNYFPYDYPVPDGQVPFRPSITVSPTPWNEGTQLVHVAIQGAVPEVQNRPPLNLVFLIDTSGSMQDANKLPLLKQSFRLLLSELRSEDQVAIVTYAGSAGQVLEPTAASEKSKILAALDRLEAGGSTAGQAGLQQAYQVAEAISSDGEVTRVVLATDGDFNVGLADPDELKEFISRKRASGTFLSVLGFGRGNLDDATMQALAQNGNGQAAYIDTLGEARKVLVDQLEGALFPIANDVKIQIEFNPAQIAEYRLIGYETRALRREDFSNDKVDAGDIGAGHSVTAIYEVTPIGSDAVRYSPLRYGTQTSADKTDEIGYFKLRYKTPGASQSQLLEQPIYFGQGDESEDVRFAYAIAGFGQLLRDSPYLGEWTYEDAIALANTSRGDDPFGYRSEAVTLMRLAQSLTK